MSKRLLLARLLHHTGALRLLEQLPSRPGILVINHHRIGDASKTRFDRGVFSDTAEGLDRQIAFLKRRMPVIAGEELEELTSGKRPITRTYAVITFDDGYLDNYTQAFPVLQHHNVPAIFFPVTEYAGTHTVTWWDQIAYLVRNSTTGIAAVSTPAPLHLRLSGECEADIHAMLRHYKRPDNQDGSRFLQELSESTGVSVPDAGRRFLSWDEARQMRRAGMEFGSHTCSHTILSQQSEAEQRWELTKSRSILERELGTRIHSLAYPVGSATAFTADTERFARDAGFTQAFAFQGGWNTPGQLSQTCIKRISPPPELQLLRSEILLHTLAPARKL